ncbi:hypothetical protein AB0I55_02440 [Actinocatenispora sera]|uniref:hypothetical protein n=1 Tax=Actinocatenispora sera TaxID=390989 RepID=UPI0033CCDA91
MVTVLLADTAPGRDRPSVATIADLLLGAATVRLRTARRWLAGDAWRRAAPLAAKLVCLLLAARAVPVLGLAATAVGGPLGWRSTLLTSAAGSLAWLAVVALSLGGRRAPATAVAGALTVAGAAGMLLDEGIAERLSISGGTSSCSAPPPLSPWRSGLPPCRPTASSASPSGSPWLSPPDSCSSPAGRCRSSGSGSRRSGSIR